MEELCCRGGRARRCEDPDAAHLRAPLLAMPVSCAIMPAIMRIMPARGGRGERGERRGARDSAAVQVRPATVKAEDGENVSDSQRIARILARSACQPYALRGQNSTF